MKKLLKQICLFMAVIFILSEIPAVKVNAVSMEASSNDTMDTATNIKLNTVYKGNIESSRDKDYYKVEITSDGEVSVNFKHKLIPGDDNTWWTIKLLNSNGTKVYMSESVRGNQDSITLKEGLPKGTYYLLVSSYYYNDYNSIEYNISVALKSSNYYEKEFNDSMSTANLISLNKTYTGKISDRNDYDYYKVVVPNDGEVSINFKHKEIPGNSSEIWKIKLLDSNNNEYMSSSILGNEDNITIKRGLPKGTYYLLVSSYYYNSFNPMNYNILVTLKSSNYYEKEFNDSMSTADTINLNKKYTGNLSDRDDKDYYKVVIPESGEVSLNFTHKQLPGNDNTYWIVKLLDSKNNVYIEKNVSGKENNVYLKKELPKGTYYIFVDRYYFDPMDYNILVNLNVKTIKLNKTSLSLDKGKTSTLTTSISPSNASNKAVTWTSSNTKVATVDANGKVTAVGAGTANITAKAKDGSGKSAVCKVTVKSQAIKVTSIKLNKTSLSLDKGKTTTLTKTTAPSNASNKAVTWTSSNTKVAKVDANGKVTAVGAGTATITAKAKDGSGKTAVCKVTVKNPVVKITSLKLSKTSLSLQKGKTTTLTKTVAPSNATNKNVIWATSNPKVATVDTNGKIKAVGIGTTYIVCATNDGSNTSALCKVTVTK